MGFCICACGNGNENFYFANDRNNIIQLKQGQIASLIGKIFPIFNFHREIVIVDLAWFGQQEQWSESWQRQGLQCSLFQIRGMTCADIITQPSPRRISYRNHGPGRSRRFALRADFSNQHHTGLRLPTLPRAGQDGVAFNEKAFLFG